jgi:hypothetical protein
MAKGTSVRAAKKVGIERSGRWDDGVAVGATEAASDPIPMFDASSLAIAITSGAITSLTVYGGEEHDVTFLPLNASGKSEGGAMAAVLMTGLSAGNWYEVPVSAFPCNYLKLVGNAAGVIKYMAAK